MKTILLTTSIAGLTFSFKAGTIVETDDKTADGYVKHGIAQPHELKEGEIAEKLVLEVPKTAKSAAEGTELPVDCPSYDLLIAEGLTTIEAVIEYADLTKIKGIGAKSAKTIVEFLNK